MTGYLYYQIMDLLVPFLRKLFVFHHRSLIGRFDQLDSVQLVNHFFRSGKILNCAVDFLTLLVLLMDFFYT